MQLDLMNSTRHRQSNEMRMSMNRRRVGGMRALLKKQQKAVTGVNQLLENQRLP